MTFDCSKHRHKTKLGADQCRAREIDRRVVHGLIEPVEIDALWHSPPRRVTLGVFEVAVYAENGVLPYGHSS